jgi:hypothetical protein
MNKLALITLLLCATVVFAQSPASNKAFFVAGTNQVDIAKVEAVTPTVMTLLSAPNALKTSSNGAIVATVSTECALWTASTITATSNGGKSTATSRAAVKVWVEVDGKPATPAEVVFCDRMQAIGMDIVSSCTITGGLVGETCTATDTITLDLFQATKNANAFSFFIGPLSPTIHSIEVKASGLVECTQNGTAVACSSATGKMFSDAKTAAAVGTRSLIVEEVNNWGAN